tara:strand:- start:553 stop:774 length:222 start_codon:yes stop_codon:yes gene_type:complete
MDTIVVENNKEDELYTIRVLVELIEEMTGIKPIWVKGSKFGIQERDYIVLGLKDKSKADKEVGKFLEEEGYFD